MFNYLEQVALQPRECKIASYRARDSIEASRHANIRILSSIEAARSGVGNVVV